MNHSVQDILDRNVVSKFNADHAVRKGDVISENDTIKVKGRGRWKTWTPSMMLRASFLGSWFYTFQRIVNCCVCVWVRLFIWNLMTWHWHHSVQFDMEAWAVVSLIRLMWVYRIIQSSHLMQLTLTSLRGLGIPTPRRSESRRTRSKRFPKWLGKVLPCSRSTALPTGYQQAHHILPL